jgi:hypothetical protein
MLEQTTVLGSDDWWLVQLAADFGADLPRLYRMQSYADGTNALPDEADAAMKDAYRRFIHMSRLNMAELIVAARVNRMKPLGFRTAATASKSGGLPQRMIDEKIFGLSPAEIAQAEQDRSDEAFAQPVASS